MKFYFVLILTCLFAFGLQAQTDSIKNADTPNPPPFPANNSNAREATFPGGNDAFSAFLGDNIIYPKRCKKKKIEGLVIISFVVEKNGEISTVRAIKEVKGAPELTVEAIRVVNSMPRWSPGTLDGKPVRVSCTVPVRFTLK